MSPGTPGTPKHRFYVEIERIEGSRVRFEPRQARQLARVLRLRTGDRVIAFNEHLDEGLLVELTHITRLEAIGEVVGTSKPAADPRTRLVVYPALLPREKAELVLRQLVEVGVSCVAPVLAARCVGHAAPDPSRRTRWEAIMREAAEQCGRGRVPRLEAPRPLANALRLAAAAGPCLMAYEEAGESAALAPALGALAPREGEPVGLFVGPEGGFTEDEVELARSLGVRLVSLGPRILRAETASPVFAALVLFARGDLG